MNAARLARVKTLLDASRVLQDSTHPLGRRARELLPGVTGLSPQNVEWALSHALETHASDEELAMLLARTPECEVAHVLLSANVFVAALRAVAIALAAAPRVFVRASRREPEMVQLLAAAAPGLFQVVDELTPRPGDHVWAYGSDATLSLLREKWPDAVRLHGHGSGFGCVMLDDTDVTSAAQTTALASGVSRDVAAFDQRGCLSPRVILLQADLSAAQRLKHALLAALQQRELEVPRGELSADERAQIQRYHATLCMVGEVTATPGGLVSLESSPMPFVLPPTGRVIHIRCVTDGIAELHTLRQHLTTIGIHHGNLGLRERLQREFTGVRVAPVGTMQTPGLDGPVDLRRWATQAPSRI